MDPEKDLEDHDEQPVPPVMIHMYLINAVLLERAQSQYYWQMTQLAVIYYSTYFFIIFITKGEALIMEQDYRILWGDVVFLPIVLFALWQIWKARKKIKRFEAASDIIDEFVRGQTTNFETVEAAVNQAMPGMFRITEVHEEE